MEDGVGEKIIVREKDVQRRRIRNNIHAPAKKERKRKSCTSIKRKKLYKLKKPPTTPMYPLSVRALLQIVAARISADIPPPISLCRCVNTERAAYTFHTER